MFPTSFFMGFCSHDLNLLVKDIFGATTKTRKRDELVSTYPDGYPFEHLLEFVNECKDIVKFFTNQHVIKARLNEIQAAQKLPALVRPAATRWGSNQAMFSTLLSNEQALLGLVSERDFVAGTTSQKLERHRIKNFVCDAHFLTYLTKALAILQPIDCLIVKYQDDSVPISSVYPDFKALPPKFAALFANGTTTMNEVDYLSALANSRFNFLCGSAHGMSYLLDPLLIGDGLLLIENEICEFPVDDEHPENNEERKRVLYAEYTNFVIACRAELSVGTF